ncbi:MOSC N-terminal beta barrel domain-containing protein [Paenibacillus sp. S-38]|uniref:MOSC N-terminal beta barrel domain-containing protein n=1 Tax=Paenibacillus sp. S-38 TaxID=3416710 RepID=UPI003CF67933
MKTRRQPVRLIGCLLLVGEISEITRYPVKSFSGENLKTCKVDTYGMYGDRFCAFYDKTKEGLAINSSGSEGI